MTETDPGSPVQPVDRLEQISAAVEYDNGLAIQMSRYSNDDVRWLVAELRVTRDQLDAATADAAESSTHLDEALANIDEASQEKGRLRAQIARLAGEVERLQEVRG